jgi:PPOX class probable F420-dependent enzyme
MVESPLTPAQTRFLEAARVGALATADGDGHPHVVPVVFVLDGGRVYTPIDGKPKGDPRGLRRLRNIRENPRVSFLVSWYEEDWAHLGFVLIRGTAMILESGSAGGRLAEEEEECRGAEALLREKYPQYETVPLGGPDSLFIRISLERATSWGMI